jgi:tetratricopeptide (TPR) repeat protein
MTQAMIATGVMLAVTLSIANARADDAQSCVGAAGVTAGSLAICDRALAAKPDGVKLVRMLTARGDYKLDATDYSGALADFEAALAAEGRASLTYDGIDKRTRLGETLRAKALTGRGRARQGLGDVAVAIANYNAAIALQPGATLAYLYRGSVFESLGRKAEAIADFRALLAVEGIKQIPQIKAYAESCLKKLGAAP